MSDTSQYFECPNCGASVKRGALACPECGSDKNTGWSDEALEATDPLLPEGYGNTDGESFDYEAYVEKEFGTSGSSSRPRKNTRQIIITVIIIILMLAYILRKLRF